MTIQIFGLTKAEEAELRKKLRALAKEHDTSMSEWMRNSVEQAYNSEFANKGTDYKEFIKKRNEGGEGERLK